MRTIEEYNRSEARATSRASARQQGFVVPDALEDAHRSGWRRRSIASSNCGASSAAARASVGLHRARSAPYVNVDARERLRNEEPVPALQPPRARRAGAYRDDRARRCAAPRSTAPGAKTCAGPRGPSGVTRRRCAQTRRRASGRGARGSRRATSSRARCDSRAFRRCCAMISPSRCSLISTATPSLAVVPEQRQQLAVPEREDDALAAARSVARTSASLRSRMRQVHREQRGSRRCAGADDPADLPLAHAPALTVARATRCRASAMIIAATRSAAPGSPSDARTRVELLDHRRAREGCADRAVGRARRRRASGSSASCTNSGATSRPATTFTSPMCGIFTSRRATAYVDALVRYATTSGQPATAASSVVVPLLHIAASAARSTVNDAECTSGNGQRPAVDRDVRRGADDDLERRIAPLELARRLDERDRDAARSPARGSPERARAPDRPARRRALRAPPRDRAASSRDRAADARRTSRRCRARGAAPPRTGGSPPPW